MSDRRGLRVPMPKKREPFVAEDEIAVHVPETGGRAGYRISMDIAEDVYSRLGREAITHAVERLSLEVVARHQGEIESTVSAFLGDRKWAEPIIRQAIQDTVHDFVTDLLRGMHGEQTP